MEQIQEITGSVIRKIRNKLNKDWSCQDFRFLCGREKGCKIYWAGILFNAGGCGFHTKGDICAWNE